MPTYEYACEGCGSFTAVRPMAEFRDPQPCPKCAALAPRITLSSPSLKGLFSSLGTGPSTPAPRGCYHGLGNCSCR